MIRLLKIFGLSLALFVPSVTFSENIVQKASVSVHKVVTFKNRKSDEIQGYATAFFARLQNGQVVGVTNNHVCQAMTLGTETFIKLVDNIKKPNYDDPKEALKVKDISLSMGQDICFFTVVGGQPKDALELGTDQNKLDRVTVVGYPGYLMNIIAEDGYISDTMDGIEPVDLVECNGLKPTHYNTIMCGLFKLAVLFQEVKLREITPNIGPGYSGSPVLDPEGKVVGIVARYIHPTEEYTNGHGMMIPVSEIKYYSKKIEFVAVTEKKAKAFSLLLNAGTEINAYTKAQAEEEKAFLEDLVKDLVEQGFGK